MIVPELVALLIAAQEVGYPFKILSQRPPVPIEDFMWSFSVPQ
jgi:hypothetical protein